MIQFNVIIIQHFLYPVYFRFEFCVEVWHKISFSIPEMFFFFLFQSGKKTIWDHAAVMAYNGIEELRDYIMETQFTNGLP